MPNFQSHLQEVQTAHKFTVTGILLDYDQRDMVFSLEPFCQKIYRTSQIAKEDIVQNLILNHG